MLVRLMCYFRKPPHIFLPKVPKTWETIEVVPTMLISYIIHLHVPLQAHDLYEDIHDMDTSDMDTKQTHQVLKYSLLSLVLYVLKTEICKLHSVMIVIF